MLDVDSACYALIAAQWTLVMRKKAREQAAESLRIVRLKFGSGLASKLEVMAMEIQLERARAEAESAESDLELAVTGGLLRTNLSDPAAYGVTP